MSQLAKLGQGGGFSGVLVVLIISADEFSSFVNFECPCEKEAHKLYSLVFLTGPALILFVLAMLKQNIFWRLITGACRPQSNFGGTSSNFGQALMKWLQIFCTAIPAPVAWWLICMLKGALYECYFWPAEGTAGNCFENSTYVEACKAPKTAENSDLDSCAAEIGRGLKAESHIIAWVAIVFLGLVLLAVFVIAKATSKHGYLQTMWISEYRKAEFETFKRKIKLRANDLAGQLVNEYLHEERSSPEWNDISRIALPRADPNAIDKILLSPLAEWADQKADNIFKGKKKASDQSAFYFLTEAEMSFKEGPRPPACTEHHVKFFSDGDFAQTLAVAMQSVEDKINS